MREFKFRAWEEFKDNKPLRCGKKGTMITDKDFSWHSISFPFRKKDLDQKFGKYYIMQYTGLKDKNGIEVYEGDIVKYKYTSREQIAEIKYNKEKLGFDFADNKVNLSYAYNFRQINNIEVIGNIYENQELLKE